MTFEKATTAKQKSKNNNPCDDRDQDVGYRSLLRYVPATEKHKRIDCCQAI